VGFSLDQVVPWGRCFEEYVAMFALSGQDLRQRLLGCGDGPASFNCTLSRRGGDVVSVDPLYQFSAQAIRQRIADTYDAVMTQTRDNRQEFVWGRIASPEVLGRLRMAAMEEFLADYPVGAREGRYVAAGLPRLPFRDRTFDLAVCSHFLFLYSAHLGADFHVAAIRELCRVAHEARIFPLLELGSVQSRHLESVAAMLRAANYPMRIETVDYEFQRGGNQMLRVWAVQ
jgi:hypothetical protein